jgi:predicted DNA-binding transcriptional regulator YafY
MNRTDRLLAIVIELQAHRSRRAEDLAATFEVSKRTIYRDVLALCEAGVPVISTPGQGYTLDEGYFLPPLSFDANEALLLLLGAEVMTRSFDAEYRRVAESAARKIAGALPERVRSEAMTLQQSMRFIEIGAPRDHELLRVVRRAIVQQRTVQFGYRGRQDAAAQRRRADPYALVHIGDVWYMVAHCHLRHDLRHFRLDRMDAPAVTAQSFERPAGPLPRPPRDERNVQVLALFDAEIAPWVREARHFFVDRMEEHPGGLLVTLRVRRAEDALQWLLSWGRHMQVLEPPELRSMIVAEATALQARHLPEPPETPESLLT